MPRFPPGTRLRFDPCESKGTLTIAWVRAYPLVNLFEPTLTKPSAFDPEKLDCRLASGALQLSHDSSRWSAYVISCQDCIMACGPSNPEITMLLNGKTSTLDLTNVPATTTATPDGFTVDLALQDAQRAKWLLQRSFARKAPDALEITTSLTVDADRQIVNYPWLTLFPGLGSFGQHKEQALFPGLEYLLDEPSSNELDIHGDKANRLSCSDEKICFPLMAMAVNHRWLSLSWNYEDYPATIFDMPDRQFNSGANLWALWSPGPREKRAEGRLDVFAPFTLKAGVLYTRTAVIAVGNGDTVVPAIQDYFRRHPLPTIPVEDCQKALKLLANGYLDSSICNGLRFRHAAITGNPKAFSSPYAGDAVVFMDWLSRMTNDPELSRRLQERLGEHSELAPANTLADHAVGHDSWNPFQHLYFDDMENFFSKCTRNSLAQLQGARPDGSFPYPLTPGHQNLKQGHWTDHANGLTADRGLATAKTLRFSANQQLRDAYLKWADKIFSLYENDVPRGAQTWEIPLHTPDILDSAFMLDHAVCAYNLTGHEKYRKLAEYWAYTGLPFLYFINPANGFGNTGLYGSIAVLGATNWTMPFWIGLPVQWCGCVYRNALYDYADMLRNSPQEARFWADIADGITLAGLQMTYIEGQNRGLLPDSFALRAQEKK